MASLSFKDRFLTPPVARAMLSPEGLLLAGTGAAVVIATGLPLLAAPLAAIGAWGARVLVAVPKNAPSERIDPFTLPEPWRDAVVEALRAQVRFQEAVGRTPRGAVRERLAAIGERIDDGVDAAWRIARRGAQLVEARDAVDAEEARDALRRAEADQGETWASGSALDRKVEALRAQIETAERLDAVVRDSWSQLQVLDARLDEAVARSIELSVSVDDASELGGLGADVDGVVSEMEALRAALEETSQASRPRRGHA